MKTTQLLALKSAERFIIAELATKEKSHLPNPTEAEQADLTAAMEVKQIVQRAIVAGEIEPDLRGEMLAALKDQHGAIDSLLARVIGLDSTFRPTKCPEWALLVKANDVIRKIESCQST